ncbi:hypothetical protein SLS56_004682 [Neofusicoccum ribis]|uniref:Uncharacterized protein n=1 Tax=Neofusicoccum ribis TaxID=45134 RepID=A0ABR3SVR9_9PEZI
MAWLCRHVVDALEKSKEGAQQKSRAPKRKADEISSNHPDEAAGSSDDRPRKKSLVVKLRVKAAKEQPRLEADGDDEFVPGGDEDDHSDSEEISKRTATKKKTTSKKGGKAASKKQDDKKSAGKKSAGKKSATDEPAGKNFYVAIASKRKQHMRASLPPPSAKFGSFELAPQKPMNGDTENKTIGDFVTA